MSSNSDGRNDKRQDREFTWKCECGEATLRVSSPATTRPSANALEILPVAINPSWRTMPPLFARVLRHLASHGPQTKEEIAAAFNMGIGGRLKYALSFMVQMDILDSKGGYSLRIPEGISQEDYRAAVLAWLDETKLDQAEADEGE